MLGKAQTTKVLGNPHRTCLPSAIQVPQFAGFRLYTVIFEAREDDEGEYYHLVTLWKATKQEQQLYAEHS